MQPTDEHSLRPFLNSSFSTGAMPLYTSSSADTTAAFLLLDLIIFFVIFSLSVEPGVLSSTSCSGSDSSDGLDLMPSNRENLRRVVDVEVDTCFCSSRSFCAVRLVLYISAPSSSSESSYEVVVSNVLVVVDDFNKDFISREEDLVIVC